ncbi:MAG: peptidoglycan-binding protein [Aureispira sp.]
MAVSEAVRERLEALKANIESFLELHKNPYDSSVHNELAAKLERIESILCNINHGDDTSSDTGGDTSGGLGDDDTSSDNSTDDNSTDTSNLARTISASVGKGGTNKEEDVRTIQGWLNSHGAGLEVNGQSDTSLINEIKKFQRRLGNSRPDGKVDPGYDTFKGLIGEKPVGPPSTGVSSIIQGGESGAAGYNAYNRGTQGNSIVGPNGHRELTAMTLATIMTNQSRAKNHADYLFAVGKYQLIPTTLKEGVTRLNLDTSLNFDENTQELLFSGYLMDKKRPQISAYIKGQPGGTAYKAGLAGAQEWASIAVPAGHAKAGRSYYDGVGGNSAHITAEDFLGALDEAKADYQKYLGQGMSDADAYKAAVSGVEDTANSGGDNTGDGTGTDTGSDNTGDGTGTDTGGDNTGDDTGTDTGSDNTGDDTGTDTGSDNTGDDTSNLSISGSVGEGGANNEADVKTIQELLNKKGGDLTVDGKIGNKTISAIRSFQSSINITPDGVISPNKNTWKGLIGTSGSVDSNASSGPGDGSFDPGEPLVSGSKPSSSNFKYGEFISPRDPVREVPSQYWNNLQKLMNNLEVIRGALGVSMNINSGYRSPGYNSQIGGASASKHMLAQAADISSSLPPSQVHATITRLIQEGKITPGGVGRYNNFTHYDIRGSFTPFNGGY